jgi:esterase/lipase superfamily enzyme
MFFVTNRILKQSPRSRKGRKVSFELNNTEAQQSVFFCRRDGPGDYIEITSQPFLAALRDSRAEQILILIHGFSNLPEDDIFPRAALLQQLFDQRRKGMVQVVPLIWPCDNDMGIIKDYWDDQKSADASAFAFARVVQKFMAWRALPEAERLPCLKRINVLAHSMGNRVLRETLNNWVKYDLRQPPPLLFRNTFMVAADVINESLERGNSGEHIAFSSRNVVVYYASDDLALRSSKISNLKNRVASRRLGHTGPEDMEKVPQNVYSIDCDDFNTRYDPIKGHSYFLTDELQHPGLVFEHLCDCVETGRVAAGATLPARRGLL